MDTLRASCPREGRGRSGADRRLLFALRYPVATGLAHTVKMSLIRFDGSVDHVRHRVCFSIVVLVDWAVAHVLLVGLRSLRESQLLVLCGSALG